MIIREQSNRIAAYSEKAKCSRLQLLHHAIIRPGEPACEGRLLCLSGRGLLPPQASEHRKAADTVIPPQASEHRKTADGVIAPQEESGREMPVRKDRIRWDRGCRRRRRLRGVRRMCRSGRNGARPLCSMNM